MQAMLAAQVIPELRGAAEIPEVLVALERRGRLVLLGQVEI